MKAVTLTIELSPEVGRRLEEEAARRGQSTAEYARTALEEKLTTTAPMPRLLPDGLPPSEPEELVALAREQGVGPVEDPSILLGDWSDDDGEDDTDVDAFLAARQQWKWQGGPGFPADERPRSRATRGSAG